MHWRFFRSAEKNIGTVPETYVTDACIYSLFNDADEVCVHVRLSSVSYPD
jgi:hypothetical protein